jgi:DNA polymerase I-like protein with 3'-5' exonuclease and polymerase domains
MLIQCDAAQLEWRVLAWLSNDPIAVREINEEIDFHTENQKTFGLPSRLIAKRYLFRTIYRGSGWSFAHDPDFIPISVDPKFWDGINEKFFKKYRGIDRCHQQWATRVASRQPIISPLGREWLILPEQKEVTNKFTGKVEVVEKLPFTVFTNYPVQGTGNDIMAVARVSLTNRINKLNHGDKILIVSTVHDSIVVDCEDEYVSVVVDLMYEVFMDIRKNLLKLWSVNSPVEFPCEVKVGPSLLEMTKVPYKGY